MAGLIFIPHQVTYPEDFDGRTLSVEKRMGLNIWPYILAYLRVHDDSKPEYIIATQFRTRYFSHDVRRHGVEVTLQRRICVDLFFSPFFDFPTNLIFLLLSLIFLFIAHLFHIFALALLVW